MLLFGVTLLWVWWRLRTGDRRPLFAATLIGILYTGDRRVRLGLSRGRPIHGFFVCLGGVLLLSGYVMGSPGPPTAR